MGGVAFALWFFLPAGLANAAPVLANKFKAFSYFDFPLDGKKSFRGKRIFGDHKTLRGLIAGVLTAIIIVCFQMLLYNNFEFFRTISRSIDYSQFEVLLLGFALGFGALAGDAIESFFKRQFSVASGKNWFPFDQIDFIVGGLLLSIPYVLLDLSQYIIIAIVWFILHPLGATIAWMLRLRDFPF